MNPPAVSVILPCYNAEAYLASTLESIRAQTYADYEVLAVDDGSKDGTGHLLDEYARDWNAAAGCEKMRVFHQPNRGLAAARNAAIARMRGQWIALQDADDLWLPTKLQECMDFLAARPDLSIVYTPMDVINLDGTPRPGRYKPCRAGWLVKELFASIFVHDPAAVFHKRVIEKCGGFDESLPVSVGNEFWLRISPHFEFGLIDKPLALRRWSEASLTHRSRLRGRQIKAAVLERFYFQQGGKDLLPRRQALRRLAHVNYSAGKLLLQRFRCREAARYLARAIGHRPTYVKAYLFLLPALLGSIVR